MTKKKAVWLAFIGIVFFLAIGITIGIFFQPIPKEFKWVIVGILVILWILYSRAFGIWAILAGLGTILSFWAGMTGMMGTSVIWAFLASLTTIKAINKQYAS